MAQALNIPFTGFRHSGGVDFGYRGYTIHLWSSTTSAGNAYERALDRDSSTVTRSSNSQAYGFSVRCLKD